jgi:alanine racemase
VRSWAEIDRAALRHNAAVVRERIGPGPEILAVVKANAYGHGVEIVVDALRGMVGMFGVANIDEAAQIRGGEVVILSPCLPSERETCLRGGWVATVSSLDEARAYAALGPCRLHVKVDTGMGRLGFHADDAVAAIDRIRHLPHVTLHSASTHLPVSDEDASFTRDQLDRFAALAAAIRRVAPDIRLHVLNSGGILAFPYAAHQIVRAGLILYGSAYPEVFQPLVRPVLTWKTRIALIRDVPAGHGISYGRTFVTTSPTRVASLAVGYADGYPRQVSNRGGRVLVHGQSCPILGRITMDQILIDVTAVPDAAAGDEVVLIGRSSGGEEIPAREVAAKADTIAWDVFTAIGTRVKRVAT